MIDWKRPIFRMSSVPPRSIAREYCGRRLTPDEYERVLDASLWPQFFAFRSLPFVMFYVVVVQPNSTLPFVAEVVLYLVFTIAGMSLLEWAFARLPAASHRRRECLRSMGFPLCIGCEYDLTDRDANAGECPECGRNLAEMPLVHLPDDGE